MKRTIFTKNEQKVVYGVSKYPNLNDSELSKKINVKLSTLTSIKKRLQNQGFYKTVTVPKLNNLGSELLAVIYTSFNPVIQLEERIKTTKKTIEVFEEIFFSVGDQDKGFSISLSKNYTNIGRINEIRTSTFGKVGLLEDEYPHEVIFPFETSNIYRFFDYARVLKKTFKIEDKQKEKKKDYSCFKKTEFVNLSKKEKKVFIELIKNPDYTTKQIGDIVSLSRHSVSRMKKRFFENDLLKRIIVPNLKKLGFEILAFYPIKFNPSNYPKENDLKFLDSSSTVFFAQRQFEAVIISVYSNYQDYKEDKMKKIRYLKENGFISHTPLIGKYIVDKMEIIKDFDFPPIVKKIIIENE